MTGTFPPTTADAPPGALTGIRVLDLSRFIAGPLCAQILGDLGAEVIKVERPSGEDARGMEPTVGGQSLYVMSYGRNKRGITLDTRHPEALGILERLVATSDVLVENYRPGTLAKMGLGPERLAELNPGLVLTSLSGFGQTGPMRDRALFDPIAQALSGLMSLTGSPDDPPTLAGAFLADHLTGVYGALGTLAALHARRATGLGQVVDVASLDVMFAALGMPPSTYLNLGVTPTRTGSRDTLSGPANVFRARDGWIYLHAGTNPLFARFCGMVGRPELLSGAWATVAGRMADIDAVEQVVKDWVAGQDCAEVSARLESAGIPFGEVLSIPEVTALPQLLEREMVVEVPHTTAGTVTLPGIPIKLGGTPGKIRHGAPDLGEHNGEVYAELLGLGPDDLARLAHDGVI